MRGGFVGQTQAAIAVTEATVVCLSYFRTEGGTIDVCGWLVY